MQLTRHTDYALRVLIFLALQRKQELVTMAEIEQHFDIPRNHLIKIVQRLGRLGYAQTVRGKGGGLRLGKAITAIRIGDVVEDMESTLELIDCHKPVCPINGDCRLKHMLNEARSAFINVLNQYTLADVVRNPQILETALNWPSDTVKETIPRH